MLFKNNILSRKGYQYFLMKKVAKAEYMVTVSCSRDFIYENGRDLSAEKGRFAQVK